MQLIDLYDCIRKVMKRYPLSRSWNIEMIRIYGYPKSGDIDVKIRYLGDLKGVTMDSENGIFSLTTVDEIVKDE